MGSMGSREGVFAPGTYVSTMIPLSDDSRQVGGDPPSQLTALGVMK